MARPNPVRNVTVTLDGVAHNGTYYLQGSLVYVLYGTARKATQIGGLPVGSVAQLLLSEMVREQRK